ncbi:unnamed protein product, partial [Brassica rapa]
MSVGVRQHTQDVRACPCYLSAHTGCPWLSVCVRLCPSVNTGRPWLSISTHISTLDVCRYPSAHTGRPCVSVSTHKTSGAIPVCPSAHTRRLWLSISTHISTLVLGLSTLTLPVDCSGDFGPRGLYVQYTQDIRGRPPAHTGRLWLSMCVSVCPFVSVSTHRTPVAVHQYTYQHVGPWTQHAGPSRGLFGSFWPTWAVCSVHTGRPWGSASTHRTTHMTSVAVCGCPSAHTGRLWLSVYYTQDVCGCPPAHTGRPWLSDVRGCPSVHISAHWSLDSACWPFPWTVRVILAHVGCLFSTHRTSVGVHKHTQDVRG